MGFFTDLVGTFANNLQLGFGGARVKSNAGVIEARNAVDSALAPIAADYYAYLPITQPATPASGIREFVELSNGLLRLRTIDASGFVTTDGRDIVLIVRNASAATINKGQPVYRAGASGGVPTVGLAQANSLTTAPAIGLAAEAIASNGFGRIMILGLLEGVNTTGMTEGGTAYLSSTTAGALTTTKPTFPTLQQRLGSVVTASTGMGRIQVRIQGLDNEEEGTISSAFHIGDNTTGAKLLQFHNGFAQSLSANPTANRTNFLPNKDGTLATTADLVIVQTATTVDIVNRSTSSLLYVSSGISVSLPNNLQSTASKVRIRFSALFSSNSAMGVAGFFRLYRGTTDVTPAGIDSLSGVRVASSADTVVTSFEFVDTPGVTGIATYTIYWRVSSATGFLGRRGLDNLFNVPSYLTAEEII